MFITFRFCRDWEFRAMKIHAQYFCENFLKFRQGWNCDSSLIHVPQLYSKFVLCSLVFIYIERNSNILQFIEGVLLWRLILPEPLPVLSNVELGTTTQSELIFEFFCIFRQKNSSAGLFLSIYNSMNSYVVKKIVRRECTAWP
jgi:hypothetical protein